MTEGVIVGIAVVGALAGGAGLAFFLRAKPAACPNCGTRGTVVRVVYGEPDRSMLKAAKQGRICLGGYHVHDDDPDTACTRCDFRWLEAPPAEAEEPPSS